MALYVLLLLSLVVALPSWAVPLSEAPRRLASSNDTVGGFTRGYIETAFGLPEGSLVIPSDGAAFEALAAANAWTPYTGTPMQLVDGGNSTTDRHCFWSPVEVTCSKQIIWEAQPAGKYYHETFVENEKGLQGRYTAIVGYVDEHRRVIYDYCCNVTELPDPLLPAKPFEDELVPLSARLVLTTLDETTCSELEGEEVFGYALEGIKEAPFKAVVTFSNIDGTAPSCKTGTPDTTETQDGGAKPSESAASVVATGRATRWCLVVMLLLAADAIIMVS